MQSFFKSLKLETKKQFELLDVTAAIKEVVTESKVSDGLVTVFCPHTTASVRLNHNEPLLFQDILKNLYDLVPVDANYSHDLFEIRQSTTPNERSNGHAHVKAFLLGSSENLIIEKGGLILGEKQSLFFVELDGGRQRQLHIKILGQ